jgi:hypothetical protein
MTGSEAIRQQFEFLEKQSGVSVIAKEYPGYAANGDVMYKFPNGSFIRIWNDRSDVYVECNQFQGRSIGLEKLCKSPARYFSEYLGLLHTHWNNTIAPWLGVEVLK